MTPPRLLDGGAAIVLDLDERTLRFHAMWLRDNTQDAATRDPATGQRLITVGDLPADTRIESADWRDGRLHLRFAPDGKQADYDPLWLIAHAYDRVALRSPGWTDATVTRWDAAAAGALPVADYQRIRSDSGALRDWLAQVRRYGFARLAGAPTQPGIACTVAALFGYVRETNYGRAFDVRVEAAPTNLAYTDRALQPHTDNPYRDPAPGLQILACLQSDAPGGETILIDGFKLAERLQSEDPHGFDLVTRHCTRFAYAGAEGVRLSAKKPLIELGADGELAAIRFNNRSAAPLVDVPYDAMEDYYAAWRRLADLIEAPELRLRFRLAPGELVLLDNLRVLHGREAFVGSGARWLEGCYADRDGLFSTLAALEEEAVDG